MKKAKKEKAPLSSDAAFSESLSEEELAMLRSQMGRKGRDRSHIPPPENESIPKPIRYAKKNTATVVITAVAVLALVLAGILLCVILSGSSSCRDKKDYTVLYIDGEEEEEVICKAKDYIIDGELYLDMNKLASFAGLTRSGTAERMKFIASETQYLEFENKSDYATVNGKTVLIPYPAYIRDGVCLVPYSVLSRMIDGGLTLRRDTAERTVTVTRKGYTEEGNRILEELLFTDHGFDVPSGSVSVETAPYEYSIDITDYLTYIDPADPAPYLILANRTTPITEDPANLTDIPKEWTGKVTDVKNYQMDAGATQALVAMMMAMAS